MIKIAIAGIGGVGGYFGGSLARYYENSKEVEIYFIARGENERAIQKNGLRLETSKGNFIAHPKLVTSYPQQIGVVDILICSTKSYDLEQSIVQSKPCIEKDTVILPLYNGVDSSERIRAMLPGNEVWEGCVYLVSHLSEPGLIKETGNVASVLFGYEKGTPDKLKNMDTILKDAGINATLSVNILQTIWRKFIFISPIATLTSYLDVGFGGILSNDDHEKILLLLLHEIKSLADAKGISFQEDIIQKTVDAMIALPKDTTTSMHRDFQKGGKNELDSLTGYVVRQGKQFNIAMPTYEMIYNKLKERVS